LKFLKKLWNRPPSQDKFAAMVIKRIRASGDSRPIVYDREEFRLRKADDSVSFLHNLYQEYLRCEPDEREGLIRNFLAMWHTTDLPLPAEFGDAKADILPALRARSFFELDLARANGGQTRTPPPYEIVAEHLAVALVYDLPTSMRTLSDEELEEWGITFYEAMEVARQNLADKPIQYAEIGSIYALASGDGYDATRLLLDDMLHSLQVSGETIAMVPNRERLYVAGSDDDEGLETMLKFAEEDLQHERYISGMAYHHNGDAWQAWLPDAEHPLHNQFLLHQLRTMGQMYADQAELLTKRFEAAGEGPFIATFSAVEDEATGRASSYCMWLEGLESLLPKTDEIFFVRPQGADPGQGVNILARARWEEVERVVGDRMELQEIYPERWRVRDFPSAEELAKFAAKPS
jgi:hypothetical protein